MHKVFGLFASVFLMFTAIPAAAQEGYVPLQPGYPGMGGASSDSIKAANALNASLDRVLNQITVNANTDNLSFDQLQSVISQFPGADKLQVIFPNQSQWMTSPSELLNIHGQFLQQAEDLGFGMEGVNIPELVFSSLKEGTSGLDSQIPGGIGGLAMIPITNLKGAMSDTLELALKQTRFDQLSLGDWMPDWLKSMFLAIYNFVMPYYYSAVNWVSSFF